MVNVVETSVLLARILSHLEGQGIEIGQVEDMSQVPQLIADLGKPYLTPFSDPAFNDFTLGNAMWLVAKREGVPIYAGCARLEDLGAESVLAYWARIMGRGYQREPAGIVSCAGGVPKHLPSGRLVYFGDLFASKEGRGARKNLRAFVAAGHLMVSLKWNPDATYCFIRERDVERGAGALYGFLDFVPEPFDWVDPPELRGQAEWLASLPRSKVHSMARRVAAKLKE